MTQEYNFINGTNGQDNIQGTSGADRITGKSGSDTIHGGDGDDIINGTGTEPGNLYEEDNVSGGGGRDLFIAGDENRAYYTANGENDCVIISDFNALEDCLQLHGSAEDYTVEVTGNKNIVISYQGDLVVLLKDYLLNNDTEFDLNNSNIVKYVAESQPNSAPDANNDIATTMFNTPITLDVLGNDSDPDGDILSVTSVEGQAIGPRQLIHTGNGYVSLLDDGQLLFLPNRGFSGDATFSYEVSDGNGGVESASVTVNVQPQPNSAPNANNDTSITEFNTPVLLDVLGNDSDPDGDTLSVTSIEGQSINPGQTVATDNGSVTLLSNGQLLFVPNLGFSGDATFSYEVSDGNGGVDDAHVSVNVQGQPNSAPDANNDTSTTEFNTPVTLNVLGNDFDPDGDTLSVTSIEGQSINSGETVATENGSVTMLGDGQLLFVPNEGFSGDANFSYEVSDGNGGVDDAHVSVNVQPQPNTAPDAKNNSYQYSESEDGGYYDGNNLLNNDTDADGDSLHITHVNGEAIGNGKWIHLEKGDVFVNKDGRIDFDANGDFDDLNDGETASVGFDYTISDGNGGTDTAHVTLKVNGEGKANVDLAINKEATNVTAGPRWSSIGYSDDIAYAFDVMRYDITVTNNSDETATGIVVNDIVPENIDLWEPGQTISDTGYSWNTHHPYWGGQFTGSPEVVDPTNGHVSISDSGTASHGLTLSPGSNYGLSQGSVTWELGEELGAGESVTLSYYGMREVYSAYNWSTGTEFFTEASIVSVDQHDDNSSNDSDSARSWWVSPLAIDLKGDGVETISIDEGVEFDILNSGEAVNTGWLSGEDGFLAVDNDGDGLITSRAELFGGEVGEGFAKLKTFDSNEDGLVNESDALFGSLKLWQDANENGITDEGELVSLESAGITDLNTDYTDVFAADVHGNIHGEHSSALKDGSSVDMVDVYFQVAI